MSNPDAAVEIPIVARVVHRSVVIDQVGLRPVIKLMVNLQPQGRRFEAGTELGFVLPGTDVADGLRRYTIEAVGEVPFEDSIDITLYVRDHGINEDGSMAPHLISLKTGDTLPVYGPFKYPFYPPMGSRSNLIIIGAGCGMVPFRALAQKIQARKLDWMGKVLMLEGNETGIDHIYLNQQGSDRDHYIDTASYRVFEALKTRYSASASDRASDLSTNMDAVWRLMGQGRVYVYLAGYKAIASAMDEAMSKHLRLAGRWAEAKSELVRTGHWLEQLYD